MKTPITVALAMLVGFGLGAISIHGLSAEEKPPGAYYIVEVTDIKDPLATSPKRIAMAERCAAVLDFRKQGYTFATIAR